MQIQKGLVKYKDRSDIVCTYGITDDGKQYYFLDDSSLSNGNIIASTVLVEAVDPVVSASSVGVIDSDGNVVLPFEFKSVKPVGDGLLLAEKANATSPSVAEAVALRSDPLSATKLVTTAATVKDKMNAKMGSDGRFLFNDQFSEATIYDLNGSNIVNGEYYSFIGMKNNETLYFSKNTVDSMVSEYSLIDNMFVTEGSVENGDSLDVENTSVTQETIDGAMENAEAVENNEFREGDITAKDFENIDIDENPLVDGLPVAETPASEGVPFEPTSVIPAVVDEISDQEKVNPSVEENKESDSVDEENLQFDSDVNVESKPGDEEMQNDETADAETDSEVGNSDVDNQQNDDISLPVDNDSAVAESTFDKIDTNEISEMDEIVDENISEQSFENQSSSTTINDLVPFDFVDNVDGVSENAIVPDNLIGESISGLDSDLLELDFDSDIFADSTLHVDTIDIEDSYGDFSYKSTGVKDTVISDVASTMSNLINLNRSQKQKLDTYQEKFEQVTMAHRKLVEKAREQIRDIGTLKSKVKNYETIVSKLEAKIQVLDNKVRDLDKVISNQNRELESLRPQVEGKEELVKVLADAQSFLEQSL